MALEDTRLFCPIINFLGSLKTLVENVAENEPSKVKTGVWCVDKQEAFNLSMGDRFVNLLKQMRYKVTRESNRKKRTKIGVVSGKSVASPEGHFSDSPHPDEIILYDLDFSLNVTFEADLSSDEDKEEMLSVKSQVVKSSPGSALLVSLPSDKTKPERAPLWDNEKRASGFDAVPKGDFSCRSPGGRTTGNDLLTQKDDILKTFNPVHINQPSVCRIMKLSSAFTCVEIDTHLKSLQQDGEERVQCVIIRWRKEAYEQDQRITWWKLKEEGLRKVFKDTRTEVTRKCDVISSMIRKIGEEVSEATSAKEPLQD
ncbi:hypothetical protein ILUMI_02900 [Ignelater luminosus]|uniref:Uncharacterized protein n=1 Tax=Ignelater luminosus TaxID=2038154 RepID=A0A8K0DFM6_IGNLU|nr:hypothetical protein ILUMI_02900 [Ignelater luminosus]